MSRSTVLGFVAPRARRAPLAAAATAALLLGAFGARANAQAPSAAAPAVATASEIEVVVIDASNGPGTSSQGLSGLPLTRPPFSAYRVFTLISRNNVPLGPTASTVSLPNGGSAAVTLTGRQPDGRYNFSVQLSTSGRTHNMQFTANRGDPVFTARTTGADAALILALIVR